VPFGYHPIDPIKEALLDAGFADLKVAVVALRKAVADIVAFARGLVCGNPVLDQIRSRGGIEPERIVEALADRLRRELGDRLTLQSITFEVTKR